MGDAVSFRNPRRISDLAAAAQAGGSVRLRTAFEIVPAEFLHKAKPFKAYIFLTRYTGAIDDRLFEFRKCYARGCPNNLCTHVSQAVLIANRYLRRDYSVLKSVGIAVEECFFSLEEMVVRFQRLKDDGPASLTIPELIELASAEGGATVRLALEIVPAVEHFAGKDNAQTFLSGEFRAWLKNKDCLCQRCFACYATECEDRERTQAIEVANARLKLVFDQFDQAGISCDKNFFN